MQKSSAFTTINEIISHLGGSRNANQIAISNYQRYQNALITIRCVPKSLSNLEQLILAGNEAVRSFSALLKVFPPNDPNIYLMQGSLYSMQSQVKVWEVLREYQTPKGKEKLYFMLKQRFEQRGGAELAYLVPWHAMERLDPIGRSNSKLERKLEGWLGQLKDKDPCEQIVEFLFNLDSNELDYGYTAGMDSDRQGSCRIVANKGLLNAYYVQPAGEAATRYIPKWHSATLAISTIHRLPLNTIGGGASRGGGDFKGGDPYVLSPEDKLYSINFEGTIHSQFLSGDAVKGAGLWVVRDGKVLLIDNRSGHYMPSWRGLLQSVQWIAEREAFHPDAAVGYVISSYDVMFFRVQDFLRLGKAGFPYEATRDMLRGYHRKYEGQIPLATPMKAHIPADYLTDWADGRKDRWNSWLTSVFPNLQGAPLVVPPPPERRFGGMA